MGGGNLWVGFSFSNNHEIMKIFHELLINFQIKDDPSFFSIWIHDELFLMCCFHIGNTKWRKLKKQEVFRIKYCVLGFLNQKVSDTFWYFIAYGRLFQSNLIFPSRLFQRKHQYLLYKQNELQDHRQANASHKLVLHLPSNLQN